MRPLVLCYSLNDRTAALGRELAEHLGAEFANIECARYRGPLGRVRLGFDLAFNRLPQIMLPQTEVSAARQIIVGGPIWAGQACGPVRSALNGPLRSCYDLMIFLTYGPSSSPVAAERAIADTRTVFGSPFQAYAAISQGEIDDRTLAATAGRLARLFRVS